MYSIEHIAMMVHNHGAESVSGKCKNYMAGLEMSAKKAADMHDENKEIGKTVKFYK